MSAADLDHSLGTTRPLRTGKDPARSVTLLALITAVCLLADSMLYVVLPLYWEEAGLSSLYEVGILLAVNRFVRLPLNPIVSWLYRRMQLTAGVVLAVGLTAAVTFLYSQASGFWFWLVLRCLWGLVWTFLRLGAFYAILQLSTDRNRGFLMGRYNGLSRLGSLVGMLAGGGLVWWLGMRPIFAAFAVLTLGALFLALQLRTAVASPSEAGQDGSEPRAGTEAVTAAPAAATLLGRLQGNLLARPVLLALLTGLATAYMFQGVFTSTLSHVLDLRMVEAGLQAGVLLNAALLGGLFQALRWLWEPWFAPWVGRKSDRPGRRIPMLIASLAAAAVLFALIPVPAPFAAWLAVLLLIQTAATFLTTLCDTIAADASAGQPDKALVITVYSMIIDLGSALGPIIAFSCSVRTLYWSSSLVLAGLAALWLLRGGARQDGRQIVH